MILRTLDEVVQSERNVVGDGFASRRFLLKNDCMGFSLHDTIVEEGAELHIGYKHHFEACYCVEGEGEVEFLAPETNTYKIVPGTVYALDKHDKHILRARRRMRLICVFYPALSGLEKHDADGSYPPPSD